MDMEQALNELMNILYHQGQNALGEATQANIANRKQSIIAHDAAQAQRIAELEGALVAVIERHTALNDGDGEYCIHCDIEKQYYPEQPIQHKPDCPVLLARQVLGGGE